MTPKKRAPLNRTVTLSEDEVKLYSENLVKLSEPVDNIFINNKVINQDFFEAAPLLPENFVNLLFVDPPYNMHKKFNTSSFREMNDDKYELWTLTWIEAIKHTLKDNASVYICCDWKSSAAVYNAAKKYFKIQNRITWEREKGRGAKANWKNCTEDIWFCTVSDKYKFNIDDVKIKRKVLAPYKEDGLPKDWQSGEDGNYRITHPSNIWTDITIPFWSMPENTDHPTQKPEKLLAKIILAGSDKGDVVFDPFLGSGTTAVVSKKLNRNYCGIESDKAYSCLAEKRLALAGQDGSIQGYDGKVFWERNTLREQKKK